MLTDEKICFLSEIFWGGHEKMLRSPDKIFLAKNTTPPPPPKKIWCHIYTTVEKNPKIPLMVSGAKVNMESGLLGTKKFVHRRYNDVKNSIDIRTFSLVA